MIKRNQNNNVQDIDDLIRENFRIILYAYDYLNVLGNRGMDFKPLKFNPLEVEELDIQNIVYSKSNPDIRFIRWSAWDGTYVYNMSTQIHKDDVIACIREGKLRMLLD